MPVCFHGTVKGQICTWSLYMFIGKSIWSFLFKIVKPAKVCTTNSNRFYTMLHQSILLTWNCFIYGTWWAGKWRIPTPFVGPRGWPLRDGLQRPLTSDGWRTRRSQRGYYFRTKLEMKRDILIKTMFNFWDFRTLFIKIEILNSDYLFFW